MLISREGKQLLYVQNQVHVNCYIVKLSHKCLTCFFQTVIATWRSHVHATLDQWLQDEVVVQTMSSNNQHVTSYLGRLQSLDDPWKEEKLWFA